MTKKKPIKVDVRVDPTHRHTFFPVAWETHVIRNERGELTGEMTKVVKARCECGAEHEINL